MTSVSAKFRRPCPVDQGPGPCCGCQAPLNDRTWSEIPSHTPPTCNSASLRCLCLGQTSTVFGFLEEAGSGESECPLSSQQTSCLCSSHVCFKASEIPQWGRAFPASLPELGSASTGSDMVFSAPRLRTPRPQAENRPLLANRRAPGWESS